MIVSPTKHICCMTIGSLVPLFGLVSCVEVMPEVGQGAQTDEPKDTSVAGRSCSSDTACIFDDVPNRALGTARLRLNEQKNLIVHNIGSSGLDGVRQFGIPHDTCLMETGLACPNFVESVAGSKAVIIMYGDTSQEMISTLTIENTDGDTLVTEADLSPIGVSRYTAEIYNGDELVARYPDLNSGVLILTGTPTDFQHVVCSLDPETGQVIIEYQTTAPTPLVAPGREQVTGDRVRIKGNDQRESPSRQIAFDNFFSNMPAVEMTYQIVESVAVER